MAFETFISMAAFECCVNSKNKTFSTHSWPLSLLAADSRRRTFTVMHRGNWESISENECRVWRNEIFAMNASLQKEIEEIDWSWPLYCVRQVERTSAMCSPMGQIILPKDNSLLLHSCTFPGKRSSGIGVERLKLEECSGINIADHRTNATHAALCTRFYISVFSVFCVSAITYYSRAIGAVASRQTIFSEHRVNIEHYPIWSNAVVVDVEHNTNVFLRHLCTWSSLIWRWQCDIYAPKPNSYFAAHT